MDDLPAWDTYLMQTLNFPFEARQISSSPEDYIARGKTVTVLGIEDLDDFYGLLASVRIDRRTYTLPLCDLEALDHSSSNYQPLDDYSVWFVNR